MEADNLQSGSSDVRRTASTSDGQDSSQTATGKKPVRVVFKDPMGTFQTNHMGNLIFPNAPPHAMLVNAQMAGARHMAPQAQAADDGRCAAG
ncbi:hypothetical protein Sste5344_002796 [Sporothrix stenoceras]